MSRSTRTFALAVASLVGTAILFAWVLADALSFEPVKAPTRQPTSPPSASPADTQAAPSVEPPRSKRPPTDVKQPGQKGSGERYASVDALSGEALAMMVRSDPFSPTRELGEPYRLPGEGVEVPVPAPPREPPPPQFRVHGTVLTPTGGIALLELDNSQRIVSVGESVQGYRLTNVDAETATVEANGRMITYRVQDPMPRRVARTTNARTAPAGNAAQERADVQRQQQVRQELLRGAMQQLQQMGDASPEVQARIMELMRGMGAAGGNAIRLGPSSGTTITTDTSRVRRPGGR